MKKLLLAHVTAVSTVAILAACNGNGASSVASDSTASSQAGAQDVNGAAAACKASVIQSVIAKANDDDASVENASFQVLTNSTDFNKPDTNAILAEVDFSESETARWIASFNGVTCKVDWAQVFVDGERMNVAPSADVDSANAQALSGSQDAIVREVVAANAASGGSDYDTLLAAGLVPTVKIIGYSAEQVASPVRSLLLEVDVNESETARWIVAVDFDAVHGGKVSWKQLFSDDR